jgi:hypothetical protein
MTRRWLQSADVEIDDDSGALLVKIGGVDLKIDTATIDMGAIVTGIAGTPNGKTLKDVVTALGSIPADPARESGHLADIAARLGSGSDSAAALLSALLATAVSTARDSSGTAPLATDGDAVLTVLAANANAVYHHVRIVNEGAAAGFYSIDGGATWNRLPVQSVVEDHGVKIVNQAVQVKRVAGASNTTGVYASAW